MTTEHSTYTYERGAQETVTLSRGPLTPHGHVLLKINYSDGGVADCYVNTAWLRDRLDDLGEPRRLTPDAITDEMVERGARVLADWDGAGGWGTPQWGGEIPESAYIHGARKALTAALTEPPARPEGAVTLAARLDEAHKGGGDVQDEADRLYAMGVRVVTEEQP